MALWCDLTVCQHLPIESVRGACVREIICGRVTDADAECILGVHMLGDRSDSSRSAGFTGL